TSLVPQKPSTPPPRTRPPRKYVVTTPVSEASPQEQGRKRSKSGPAVLLSSSPASSMRSTSRPALPDLEGRMVRFEEAPEIVLFLSDPEEGRAARLPVVRPLAPIAEVVAYTVWEAKADAKVSWLLRRRFVGAQRRETSYHIPGA
ncbi:unnamed protein product, partial [Symbiodinium sp. CCMP2592]